MTKQIHTLTILQSLKFNTIFRIKGITDIKSVIPFLFQKNYTKSTCFLGIFLISKINYCETQLINAYKTDIYIDKSNLIMYIINKNRETYYNI
jgi:hypothetical protein